MSFKFKARVLLELGAELISSDSVALYELIKNSLDAGSESVDVEVVVGMQPSAFRSIAAAWSKAGRRWDVDTFIEEVKESLEPSSDEKTRSQLLSLLGTPTSAPAAVKALEEAVFQTNSIKVLDTGHGMNAAALKRSYLTVGTPDRLHEKEAIIKAGPTSGRQIIPLGEKGIGRLAAMRLGHHVEVLTGVIGESHWHVLELDWRPVFEQPDLDADALKFVPTKGADKKIRHQGTDVIIRDLQSDWLPDKLAGLWSTDLSKLSDPFAADYDSDFINITYQGVDCAPAHPFDRNYLDKADAYCKIEFGSSSAPGGVPRLRVLVEYRRFKAAVEGIYEGAHLESLVSGEPRRTGRKKAAELLPGSDEVIAALPSLGPFDAEFYWFNRGRINRETPQVWQDIGNFVRNWSGGLLVYRDGFRVYPYGAASDDWLDLDRKALASSAFKLNRAQIVGRLSVSSARNPRLKDQTNREGFRDCPEKEALRRLLRQAIIGDCRSFLEKVDKEKKGLDSSDVDGIDKKIASSKSSATKSLLAIQKRAPSERDVVQSILANLAEVEEAWGKAKSALAERGDQLQQYIHLAGVGLTVEFIAHELARTTDAALDVLKGAKGGISAAQLASLQAQLKTINKRVRVLDELSIPGRQIKSMQDLYEIAGVMKDVYDSKAVRHGIVIDVRHKGKANKIRVERGQIMQILDNLLSNSMYWLTRRVDRNVPPRIDVVVDYDASTIEITDNGPGIPASISSRIFDAFFTTKPIGDGRGLGLAIATHLAESNDATLRLAAPKSGIHNGFIITFKA